MDELARAADVSVCRISTTRFVSGLPDIFKMNTMNVISAFVCGVATEYGRIKPDMGLWVAFAKLGHLIGNTF